MGCWMEGLLKLLGIWFGPDLQAEKNRDEVMSRVAKFTQKLAKGKLFLKDKAEVVNIYIASIIYYGLLD